MSANPLGDESEHLQLDTRNRQILDAIADLVLVKGPGSRIVWANKAFREFYGMTAEQVQGMIDAPFNEPDFTQQYVRDDAYVMTTGKTLDIPEERVTRHDGQQFAFHTVKSPILNAAGEVVMLVAVCRDITPSKQLAARLGIADRMATIGTLAAGIAHEINNPLAYLMTNLDLMIEGIRGLAISPAAVRELEEMGTDAREGAERVRKVVRGLKTFSRADAERLEVVDVRAVLETSVSMTFNEIRHRARLVKDFGPLPRVEADEARLGQVFINLLVNSAQAIAEGNVDENEIRITTSTDAAGSAVISVRDTGRGVKQAHRQRIFDPFFTTKEIGVGTGLGLSICHGIVTSMKGQIRVDSDGATWTNMTVTLPACSAGSAEAASRSRPPIVATGRHGRVLIIEDDARVAAALRRALDPPHEVVLTASGRAGLDLLRSGASFDVILCDLLMAEMTGMDLHDELAISNPEITDKLVFITGGTFTQRARDFLAAIPNHRLEKPIDLQNLRALVRDRVR